MFVIRFDHESESWGWTCPLGHGREGYASPSFANIGSHTHQCEPPAEEDMEPRFPEFMEPCS